VATIKACADCKHLQTGIMAMILGNSLKACLRTGRRIDPVSGKPENLFASLERRTHYPNWADKCNHEGKFWEAK
jgi:hypothetical protein